MKKLIFSALAAIGLLLSPSCSDENEVLSGSDNEALVSFNVNLADGISTKATSGTTLGNGTKATNLVVEVYEAGDASGDEVFRKNNVSLSDLKATVDFVLVKGKKYDIIFWAQHEATDNAGYYDVSDLRTIKVNYDSKASNDENRDAFVAVKKGFSISGPEAIDVKLTRPFAQVNFMVPATDIAAAHAASFDFESAKTGITISNVAKQLNPLSNTVEGTGQNVVFTPAFIPFKGKNYKTMESTDADKLNIAETNHYYLATTYILVNANGSTANPAAEQDLVNATLTICEDGTNETHTIPVNNIPVRQNYRTNIYGNLLTAGGTFKVEIDNGFGDNINKNVVMTPDEMKTAIASGTRVFNLTVTEDGNTIYVPKVFETRNSETLTFNVTNNTTNGARIEYEGTTARSTGTLAPAKVIIKSSGNWNINLPESRVTLFGTDAGSIGNITVEGNETSMIFPVGQTYGTITFAEGITGTVWNYSSQTITEPGGVTVKNSACNVFDGNVGFTTLNEAISRNERNLILMQDITLDSPVTLDDYYYIDLKGQRINNKTLILTGSNQITFKNSGQYTSTVTIDKSEFKGDLKIVGDVTVTDENGDIVTGN